MADVLKWLGKPDALEVGLLLGLWAFPGRWRVLGALIMVLAHGEMGTAFVLMLYFLEPRRDNNLLVALVMAISCNSFISMASSPSRCKAAGMTTPCSRMTILPPSPMCRAFM